MSRVPLRAVSAALVAVSFAACTDAPVQPDAAGSAPAVARAAQGAERVAPGEVLLQLKPGATLDAVLRPHGAAKKGEGYQGRFLIASTRVGNERALAATLARDPRVEFAEPNYIRTVETIDSRLWAFYNPGGLNMSFYNDADGRTGLIPSSYASIRDADEDNIEGYAAGGSAVVISSLDTGVDYAHPEFAGRLLRGCDWYAQSAAGNSSRTCTDDTSDDTPDQGHGTHTTGTMAGSTVGVSGVAGAGANVQVLVQRVCGEVGCYTSSIVNAIYAAANHPGMVAMNLSLGGSTESTAEKNAISYAVNTKGVLVIASAGNSGTSRVGCPACDPNAISVASTTWKDELASYSQYGKGLDISAPGGLCYSNTTEEGCIFSAVVAGYQGGRTYGGQLPGGAYAYMNGTSMAAPQVTGTAAIVASKLNLRGSALRNRLLSTADDKGAAGYDTRFGYGRVNSYRAVTGTTLLSPQ